MIIPQKLTDAFNKYAGKIVSENEWNAIMAAEMEELLTPKQMEKVMEIIQKPSSRTKTEAINELLERKDIQDAIAQITEDKTSGQYEADGVEYLDVNKVRFLMENEHLAPFLIQYPDRIMAKINTAITTTLEKTHDYREDIKAGKLTLTPKK